LNFDAGGSTAATGTTIVRYNWVWGDGTSTETTDPQIAHVFSTGLPVGTYVVRLTVRDSLGRTATTTASVTVS
jgi:microbial collagenase